MDVRGANETLAEVFGAHANEKGYKKVYLMAPNYQAGKDFLSGFKRTFKGQILDEVYTPLNQPDFSAELAQVAAKNPDAVYVFYPGGLGVNFVRQYQQAGLLGSRAIKWNFTKFLVDRDGKVVGRYGPQVAPGSLEKDIEKLLA